MKLINILFIVFISTSALAASGGGTDHQRILKLEDQVNTLKERVGYLDAITKSNLKLIKSLGKIRKMDADINTKMFDDVNKRSKESNEDNLKMIKELFKLNKLLTLRVKLLHAKNAEDVKIINPDKELKKIKSE